MKYFFYIIFFCITHPHKTVISQDTQDNPLSQHTAGSLDTSFGLNKTGIVTTAIGMR